MKSQLAHPFRLFDHSCHAPSPAQHVPTLHLCLFPWMGSLIPAIRDYPRLRCVLPNLDCSSRSCHSLLHQLLAVVGVGIFPPSSDAADRRCRLLCPGSGFPNSQANQLVCYLCTWCGLGGGSLFWEGVSQFRQPAKQFSSFCLCFLLVFVTGAS